MSALSRRQALGAAAVTGAALSATGHARRAEAITYLVCHGAWSGGWSWRKMRPIWHDPPRSHLFVPTLTGVGERAHLASADVDLITHIQDVVNAIEMEELSDVILIGFSYGGMVATGVADRVSNRVRQLIYLDAFVPTQGEALFDITGAPKTGLPLLLPPRPIPPDTSAQDQFWIARHRTPHPSRCFTTPLTLRNAERLPPRSYIRCTRTAPDDPLLKSYKRAQTAGWPCVEIDASHSPHITAPDLLAGAVSRLLLA